MKYALFSDIHSNLPALEAVPTDIDSREDVDAVYHLGDLGGYAAVLSVSQVIVVVAVLVPATTSRGHVNGTGLAVMVAANLFSSLYRRSFSWWGRERGGARTPSLLVTVA